MERKSGSVRNVPRNMLFNPTGKLTPKPAAPESISATVEHFFLGITIDLHIVLAFGFHVVAYHVEGFMSFCFEFNVIE